MARGTQHRKRRPAQNARAAAVAAPARKQKDKTPQWQDELFFSRLRNHAKWAYVFLAVAFVQNGLPLVVAILLAIAAGAVAGLIFGLLRTAFGVPSFVITLAGLLGFLGVQLYVLGARGSINIPFESVIVQFAQQWFLPDWASYLVVGLAVVVYAVNSRLTRADADDSSRGDSGPSTRAVFR